MQKAIGQKINVIVEYLVTKNERIDQRIVPISFLLKDGRKLNVKEIIHSYSEFVGDSTQVFLTVLTNSGNFFQIMFDQRSIRWTLVLGLDSEGMELG
ncbi:MAG: hypothetical protein WD267_05680 [Balneolales bacterium]